MMSQGMNQEVGFLNSLAPYIFSVFAPLKETFFWKKSQKMLFAHFTNYLNKENNHNVKVFSGLVMTLRPK